MGPSSSTPEGMATQKATQQQQHNHQDILNRYAKLGATSSLVRGSARRDDGSASARADGVYEAQGARSHTNRAGSTTRTLPASTLFPSHHQHQHHCCVEKRPEESYTRRLSANTARQRSFQMCEQRRRRTRTSSLQGDIDGRGSEGRPSRCRRRRLDVAEPQGGGRDRRRCSPPPLMRSDSELARPHTFLRARQYCAESAHLQTGEDEGKGGGGSGGARRSVVVGFLN